MNVRVLVIVSLLVVIVVPCMLYKPLREDCLSDRTLKDTAFDVYLINLDSDKKRLKSFDFMYRQCDIYKTHSPIRFSAIDGGKIDIKPPLVTPKAHLEILTAEKRKYRSKHYELTRGAVGCWLSHVGVWKQFLESDKEVAFVLEDDCIIVKDFYEQLGRVRLPKDWDIVLLGYVCNRCSNQECGDAVRVHRYFGMHAYMITRSFVEKFMVSPYATSINKQIDSVLSDLSAEGTIKIYAARRKIAWQNNRHPTRIQMPIRMVPGVDVWE